MKIDTTGNWKLYWTGPLPEGAKALGTVTRDEGSTGALIETPAGLYVQGNASALRSLPQRDVIVRLHMADMARKTSPARAAASATNGAMGGRPKKNAKR